VEPPASQTTDEEEDALDEGGTHGGGVSGGSIAVSPLNRESLAARAVSTVGSDRELRKKAAISYVGSQSTAKKKGKQVQSKFVTEDQDMDHEPGTDGSAMSIDSISKLDELKDILTDIITHVRENPLLAAEDLLDTLRNKKRHGPAASLPAASLPAASRRESIPLGIASHGVEVLSLAFTCRS
jgi:hypothetical protein